LVLKPVGHERRGCQLVRVLENLVAMSFEYFRVVSFDPQRLDVQNVRQVDDSNDDNDPDPEHI